MNNAESLIQDYARQGKEVLTETEAKQVFAAAGIPVTETRLAKSLKETLEISRATGFPVVLKIASPDVVHKSDAGGVKTNLKSAAEVTRAYRDIMTSVKAKFPHAGIEGVSVQSMARPGLETIIGMTRDPQFGPVIMFGLGGIFVEVLKDVAFRLIPLSPRDAAEMVREIKGSALLNGVRGQEPAHIPSLIEVMLKVSALVERNPRIKELDLNPVFAYRDAAVAVDARLVLEKQANPA